MFNYMLKLSAVLSILNLCAHAISNNVENEMENVIQDNIEFTDSMQREFIISWHAHRALHKILQQMPCGWPDLHIPPMAPYENENLTFNMLSNDTTSYTTFQPLRIDGLNNMDFNKLEVSLLTFSKHINFDFNFPNITATGKFNLSTIIDHSDIGVKLNFEGLGQLNFSLENVRIRGTFKFNLPLLWGSVKIYDFKTTLTLGGVRSQLNGTLNGKPITSSANSAIEEKLLAGVNDNQILISSLMEQSLVPRVNEQLKGKNLWNIIKWSLLSDESECMAGGDEKN